MKQNLARAERARLQSDLLMQTHKALSELDPLDENRDLLDHIARRARVLRDTARHAALEAGR